MPQLKIKAFHRIQHWNRTLKVQKGSAADESSKTDSPQLKIHN